MKKPDGEERFYEALDGWVSASPSALPESLLILARRMLTPDIDRRLDLILRRYHGSRRDPFGFDLGYAAYVLVVAGLIYRYYFRVSMSGVENVPPGGCLLVSNHSGQIPLDGVMIATGLLLEPEEPRLVRSLYEKWAATLPFVSTFFSRCGQIVGRPENLKRLLRRGEIVLVFPEGVKGIVKPFSRAYALSDFGLGFMRLALENDTPVVPVAVIGAEEQYPSLANLEGVARSVRMPGLPLPIQAFVPVLGLLPLPAKYRIIIGEPMTFHGNPDDEDSVIEEKVWAVKHALELMLSKGLKERKHIFW